MRPQAVAPSSSFVGEQRWSLPRVKPWHKRIPEGSVEDAQLVVDVEVESPELLLSLEEASSSACTSRMGKGPSASGAGCSKGNKVCSSESLDRIQEAVSWSAAWRCGQVWVKELSVGKARPFRRKSSTFALRLPGTALWRWASKALLSDLRSVTRPTACP